MSFPEELLAAIVFAPALISRIAVMCVVGGLYAFHNNNNARKSDIRGDFASLGYVNDFTVALTSRGGAR